MYVPNATVNNHAMRAKAIYKVSHGIREQRYIQLDAMMVSVRSRSNPFFNVILWAIEQVKRIVFSVWSATAAYRYGIEYIYKSNF
jgi:hypothetical protein